MSRVKLLAVAVALVALAAGLASCTSPASGGGPPTTTTTTTAVPTVPAAGCYGPNAQGILAGQGDVQFSGTLSEHNTFGSSTNNGTCANPVGVVTTVLASTLNDANAKCMAITTGHVGAAPENNIALYIPALGALWSCLDQIP
jgi:hypothetical protein